MSQRKESLSLGRREGSRRATCVYIAVSGTGSPPCRAPCVLFGSGHPLSGTTQVASDASQSTLDSLYQNNLFKVLLWLQCTRQDLSNVYLDFTCLNCCIIICDYRKTSSYLCCLATKWQQQHLKQKTKEMSDTVTEVTKAS